GEKNGQFRTPHGQWLDARNKDKPVIVVCDRANARLQWFNPDGTFISASAPRELVLFPANAETRGDVLLLPDLHARVSILDKENRRFVPRGGDRGGRERVAASLNRGRAIRSQRKEWPAGNFVPPHAACFDKEGNIFVVGGVATGRVTFLKKVA